MLAGVNRMTIVVIIGRVAEHISENARVVEVQRPSKNDHGDFERYFLNVRYWNGAKTCALMQLKDGTAVCLKGRLEVDGELGVYVLVEQIDYPFGREL